MALSEDTDIGHNDDAGGGISEIERDAVASTTLWVMASEGVNTLPDRGGAKVTRGRGARLS
jgi:hypothetical protein